MSDGTTKKMIRSYNATALVTMFLAGFFRSPPMNYHTSEKIEFDITRDEEEVAIVIQDLSTGARINSEDLFTNKEITPPIFDEEGTINSFDLIHRIAGQNPYEEVSFQAKATIKAFSLFRKLEAKIRRSIELMASQVLQTGRVTLRDKNGVALYEVDFGRKATNFPDAGTPWNEVGADPLADLQALAAAIRTSGRVRPNLLIFGDDAWNDFLKNADVRAQLDNRKMNVSSVEPELRGEGATYQGWFWVGSYRFEAYTYDAFYIDPQTREATNYVSPSKVIMLSTTGTVLDLTFGAIPQIVPPESRVLPFLPARIPNEQGGMDLSTYAWITPDGKALKVSAGTRPMTVPTGIDTFGCLETRPE